MPAAHSLGYSIGETRAILDLGQSGAGAPTRLGAPNIANGSSPTGERAVAAAPLSEENQKPDTGECDRRRDRGQNALESCKLNAALRAKAGARPRLSGSIAPDPTLYPNPAGRDTYAAEHPKRPLRRQMTAGATPMGDRLTVGQRTLTPPV